MFGWGRLNTYSCKWKRWQRREQAYRVQTKWHKARTEGNETSIEKHASRKIELFSEGDHGGIQWRWQEIPNQKGADKWNVNSVIVN
mgnify:CR=1 FL=1